MRIHRFARFLTNGKVEVNLSVFMKTKDMKRGVKYPIRKGDLGKTKVIDLKEMNMSEAIKTLSIIEDMAKEACER